MQRDDPRGPICPSCTLSEPGPDFERLSGCTPFLIKTPVSIEAARAAGFDIDALHALVERDFEASLHWSSEQAVPGRSGGRHAAPPIGYSSDTRVQGAIRLGELAHVRLDRQRCDAQGECGDVGGWVNASCPQYSDTLSFELELMLETDDEALSIDGPGWSLIRKGKLSSARGAAQFDIREVEGRLRVAPAREGPHGGSVLVGLFFYPRTTRGQIRLFLSSREEHSQPDAAWGSNPLTATWPSDECGFGGRPLDELDVAERLLLGDLDQRFEANRARSNAASPHTVSWEEVDPQTAAGAPLVASTRTLEFEVSDATSRWCVGEHQISFDVQTRVRLDGKLDWTESMQASMQRFPEDRPSFTLSWHQTLGPDDPRWTSSFAGVDLLGGVGGYVWLSVAQPGGGCAEIPPPSAPASGEFQVLTVPRCQHDPYCTVAPSDGRPPIPVARTSW